MSSSQGVLAHLLFECLAYATGFSLYRRGRARAGDFLPTTERWTLVVAAVVGAALGSKVLHHLASPTALAANWRDPLYLIMSDGFAEEGHMGKGFALGIGYLLLSQIPGLIEPSWFLFIGVTQLLGMLPAIYIHRRKKRTRLGIILVAALTFLLNALCGAVMLFFVFSEYGNL